MKKENLQKMTWIGRFKLCCEIKYQVKDNEKKEYIDELVELAKYPNKQFEDVWGVYSGEVAYAILCKCKSLYANKARKEIESKYEYLEKNDRVDHIYNFIG